MAKEPQDRDEAKRSDAPADAGGGFNRRDAGRAKSDGPNPAPEDNFLLDVGEEAPRVQSASEDDASEEWILVDDDLVAAAAEADSAALPRPVAKTTGPDKNREDEAARLVDDMKEVSADFAPVTPFDENSSGAEPVAAMPEEEAAAIAPVDFDAPNAEGAGDSNAAAIAPAADDLALAPVLDLPAPDSKKKAPRSPRKGMSRAAGVAIAATLVAGGWIAWQKFGPNAPSPTEVATQPTVEKPVAPPAPIPVAKPVAKKPEIEKSRPVDPPPDLSAKNPAKPDPTPTTAGPTPSKGATLPVIPVDATPDPAPAPGAALPKPVARDPNAKPANSKGTPASIVNAKQPIRPAQPLGVASAKSTTTTAKTDTIVELHNGYTLRGRIKRVKDDQITLGVPGGEFTFAVADVKILDSSAPDYLSEADMQSVSIVLTTGQRMRGKLLKMNADHVVLVVDHGQIVIDRKTIRDVSFTGRIHF